MDPKSVVFYSSGRTSLEASYMYGLMARMYGNQNLPDSSNMCHESTSVGLKAAIGEAVGTTRQKDFDDCNAIFFFGQNVGSNSPRMLHDLRKVRKRGVEIITFNPLRERGLERFTDPQNPIEMATLKETGISTQYHQVKAGGDIAAMMGLAKFLISGTMPPRRLAIRLCWIMSLSSSTPRTFLCSPTRCARRAGKTLSGNQASPDGIWNRRRASMRDPRPCWASTAWASPSM